MSIIYDALIKTQKARQHQSEVEIELPNEEPYVSASVSSRVKIVVISVISILLMLLVFAVSRAVPEQVREVIPAVATVEVSLPSSSSGSKIANVWRSFVELMPKRHTIIESQYKSQHMLNGVFLSSDEKMAMINKRMFHRGEEVDGMVIRAIDTEGVQLAHGDQVIFLRLQG